VSSEHTAHHADCGCMTAAWEVEIAALCAENAALAATIEAVRQQVEQVEIRARALRAIELTGYGHARADAFEESATLLARALAGQEPGQPSEGSSKTPGKLGQEDSDDE
jgi:hypothetical protein